MSTDDIWASGNAYEAYVGRWSEQVALELLTWLGAEPDRQWLDVGCGTGALTGTVLRSAAPAHVYAIDASHAFVEFARQRVRDDRAAFAVADARALPHASERVDVVISGLVLNFVPQPASALGEMTRVTRRGGTVAIYVWDYASGMQLMRYFWEAAVALDAQAAELDEARRFPICAPDVLEALFRQSGLRGVEVRPIDVPTRFRDFDDYWRPFLGGQGPAPGYAMRLSEGGRNRLRERLRSKLPVAADGSIDLTARAWAVRGRRE